MTLAASRAAVDAELARRREIRDTSFGQWIAIRFAVSLALFFGVAFAVRAFMVDAPALRDMSGWTLTILIGVPAFMACLVTIVAERITFGDGALDSDRAAARLNRELERLTGPRWPLRALIAGLELALCVGIVLAVVAYWTGRPAVLARGSDQAIIVFAAGTLLVSLIVVFAIRAATLYSYRRLVLPDAAGPSPASTG